MQDLVGRRGVAASVAYSRNSVTSERGDCVGRVWWRALCRVTHQVERARLFRKWITKGETFVFPEAWDVASARIFADAGCQCIGTSSAAIRWASGHRHALRAAATCRSMPILTAPPPCSRRTSVARSPLRWPWAAPALPSAIPSAMARTPCCPFPIWRRACRPRARPARRADIAPSSPRARTLISAAP